MTGRCTAQGFLAHCVATCDSQQCNARDACAMLWALGVLQPRLTPELAAFVGDLVDVVDGSVEAPLLQLRDWADMLWAIATLAGQRQGSPFGPFGQHNAAAVLQRSHPLTLALREHQAAAKRASSDGVRPEDAHPPRAETAAHRQDARLVEASESIVRQASAAIGRLSSFDPARFKRLSADTVVALLTSAGTCASGVRVDNVHVDRRPCTACLCVEASLTSSSTTGIVCGGAQPQAPGLSLLATAHKCAGFAALGIPKKEFHGPELLCKLSTRRMRSGHMQALSRPPQLAAAAAAASAIRASDRPAQIGSAPAEGDWAERFCGAIDAAICKHLAGVHLRMSPSSPPSTWARAARPRSRAPEGESATERAQRAGLEALSESVRDIEAQVGVATGESAEARQAAARRADEAQELAELCVHAASVAQSLAACGMQPSATLGLAVQPMLGTLLEQGDALGECSPAMSQLLGGVQGAAWTEREAQAAVTREAVQQLGGITCAPPA